MLTKEQVVQWKNSPVTQEYFNTLRQSRQNILEFIATGGVVGGSVDETAQELSRELGKLRMVDDILEFKFEDMIEDAVDISEEDV